MNKIILAGGKFQTKQIDDSLEVTLNKNTILNIITLKIKIKKDTSIEIENRSKNNLKLDVLINVDKNVKVQIYELKTGTFKISNRYYLQENSSLDIYKINDAREINESTTVNLNGKNASINYILKTISQDKQVYNIAVYHNKAKTKSMIVNNGVAQNKGKIKFNVSGFVSKGVKECFLNQKGQIINLTNNTCEIKPNLFIDENDVVANHSAHIGKCDERQMFYLKSRGISEKQAQNLIIKGFLTKGLNRYTNQMKKIIDKHWR